MAHFLAHCLPHFGRYQDALSERGWSLFHSRLSFSLNSKMLHPLEVIRAAEAHWQANQGTITLAQVEGFIRQILGWREFVRTLYWDKMPDYQQTNFLGPSGRYPVFSGAAKLGWPACATPLASLWSTPTPTISSG